MNVSGPRLTLELIARSILNTIYVTAFVKWVLIHGSNLVTFKRLIFIYKYAIKLKSFCYISVIMDKFCYPLLKLYIKHKPSYISFNSKNLDVCVRPLFTYPITYVKSFEGKGLPVT